MKNVNTYWSIIPSIEIIEISALAGYNAVLIDMEHGPYSFSEVRTSVSVAQGAGIKAFVRPASKSSRELLSCLETGADGLMIPHVSTKAEMESIVDSVFYSPIGNRGASGYTRATKYGDIPFPEHRKKANDNIFIGILIESIEGLNNIEDILSVGHIDCIYFGTYDIAVSMGLDNQMDMKVQNAVKEALDKTEGKVNFYGQVSVNKEQRQILDNRVNFIAHGVDCGIVLEGFKNNLR